jgi:hypothetical protein
VALKHGHVYYGKLNGKVVTKGTGGGFYVLSGSGHWNPVATSDKAKVVKG